MGRDGLLNIRGENPWGQLAGWQPHLSIVFWLGREGPDWGTGWYDCEGEITGTGTWKNLGLSPWGGNGDTKTPDRFACGA